MTLNHKVLSIILAIVLTIIFTSIGCANDSGEKQGDGSSAYGEGNRRPQLVYMYEVIPFPEDLTDVGNVAFSDNAVYFIARGHINESTYKLFSMDVDGSNLIELSAFVPGTAIPEGFIVIDFLHIDNNGYLWVLESTNLYTTVRMLDKTGADILAIDISNHIKNGFSFIDTPELNTDDAGNIYIASGTDIYVFDEAGNLLFNLDKPEIDAYLVYLSTGSVSLSAWNGAQQYLREIDINNKSWGVTTNLPSEIRGVRSVFSGNDEFLFLYSSKSHLTGIHAETRELVNILSWTDSNISPSNINNVMLLSDERIAATRQIRTWASGISPDTEFLLFTESTNLDLPERETLTLATFRYDDHLNYIVEQFNRSSSTHQIQVMDYMLFGDDFTHGLLRLNTEMIAGRGPDILDVWILPVQNYAPKGFLVDLYPLIDADPEFNRDSFVEGVLKALETDGSLYRISPSFLFHTVFGNPSVLGSYPGWNMDEFINVFNENPQADMPIGFYSSSMYFLSVILTANLDLYIDRASGTAYFDSEEFIDLLELADTFPTDMADSSRYDQHEAHMYIFTGRQIMEMGTFSTFGHIRLNRTGFGGEIVFKGFPSADRNGNTIRPRTSIAITSTCKDIDAAWEFLRMFLMEDYQRNYITRSFPVNKVVFEERLKEQMVDDRAQFTTSTGEKIAIKPFSEEEADMIRSVINNTTRLIAEGDNSLWEIVTESAEDFFNGKITARDAARIIQSRAIIYLSEQS